jgi:hypothetical protein
MLPQRLNTDHSASHLFSIISSVLKSQRSQLLRAGWIRRALLHKNLTMKDPLPSDVPRSQIAAEARNLLEHHQAFAYLNVSKPAEAHSAINPSPDLIQRIK